MYLPTDHSWSRGPLLLRGLVGLGGTFEDPLRRLDNRFASGPDTSESERLTPQQALQAFAEHEKQGLSHSVWILVTPFIGGICKCDRAECLATRATVKHQVKAMFRAEYVAAVNFELCTGCGSCMRVCQFGTLTHSTANRKVFWDQAFCSGCGVCQSVCQKEAITLNSRTEVPAVTDLW